jgi:hypothetical protein
VINSKQINNLLVMTPHFYRATEQAREATGKVKELDVSGDVVCATLQQR